MVERNVRHPAGEQRGGQEVGRQCTDNKVSITAIRIYGNPEDQDYVTRGAYGLGRGETKGHFIPIRTGRGIATGNYFGRSQ